MNDDMQEGGTGRNGRASRLTLICRGATASNRLSRLSSDEPLLPKEALRARLLAGRLPSSDAVLSAPEAAARETAALLCAAPVPCDALRDVDYGRWNGRRIDEIAADEPSGLQAWMADPAATPHGGESFEAVRARCAAWLDGQHGAGGHRLAVTHAIVLKIVLAHILQAPLAAVWRADVEPLGLMTLTSDSRRWALRFFGALADPASG
ncbi:histidine phosphatase family protein [Shinella sp.]|uniref:histidine phosphatase family protein n=1 Tax=Shinella sp. TaxID=1870904 RepID=UPI00301D10F7